MTAPMTTPATSAGSGSVLDVESTAPQADAVETLAGELLTSTPCRACTA